jgi:hypothetical protein
MGRGKGEGRKGKEGKERKGIKGTSNIFIGVTISEN